MGELTGNGGKVEIGRIFLASRFPFHRSRPSLLSASHDPRVTTSQQQRLTPLHLRS